MNLRVSFLFVRPLPLAARGRVEKGMDADLVVLDAHPARDVRNLAKVMFTIRGGKILYSSHGKLE
jgi:imidazolonepropionase-like amidohydrolase